MTDLSAVGTGHLRALRERLKVGRLADPLTRWDATDVPALVGLGCAEAARLLDAVLAERARAVPAPELVWTGPAPLHAAMLDTAVTLKQLFHRARRRVLVAGYSFDHGREIFAPLHTAMVQHGVTTDFFLHVPVADHERPALRATDTREALVRRKLTDFLAVNWPGAPYPALHYDPRPLEGPIWASLHAKCVVVDEAEALVTSANFTNRGQDRNVEVGALIRDPRYAGALAAQWRNAQAQGMFVRFEP
ncbi:MAG: phospholipase [Myxococcales bacterium]|nr:phospholipase [Myxococcales bacterium]